MPKNETFELKVILKDMMPVYLEHKGTMTSLREELAHLGKTGVVMENGKYYPPHKIIMINYTIKEVSK